MSFTSMGFKGGAVANGVQVVAQGIAPMLVGGIFSTSSDNDGNEAYFGYVMTALLATPNEFLAGVPTNGILRGISVFNANIAQNDPSKNNYYLKGTQMTVCIEGLLRFNSWGTTATGAAQPNLTSKIIFKDTTGEIEFVNSGTAVPSGWTQLTNSKVVDIDPTGQDGIVILFKL